MSQPKYYGLNELREMFLHFFETKGHLRLPSFSLIPQNDASLLLINSGMAPMKPFFTGEQEPPRHRVTTCQKCILLLFQILPAFTRNLLPVCFFQGSFRIFLQLFIFHFNIHVDNLFQIDIILFEWASGIVGLHHYLNLFADPV